MDSLIEQEVAKMSQYGAAFEPYVGRWTGTPPHTSTPLWNSYSLPDIVDMLEVISTQFRKISTYGMGYAGYYAPKTPWNQVDSNCHVAGAAAQLNTEGNAIEVSQGIYQQPTAALQQAEINAAFSAAKAANDIFPNTVTSFVFTNEYVTDAATTDAITLMIRSHTQKAHSLHINVGVRSNTFGNINNSKCPYLTNLQALVKSCDFILCNMYPADKTATPQEGVNTVGKAFIKIKDTVKTLNPHCEVMIGETGWPSQGISFNRTDNNVKNLLDYFKAFSTWASRTSVMTYFFEAIDEPWKSNKNASVPPTNPWQGPNGAEGHYGLWYLNDEGSYTKKKAP